MMAVNKISMRRKSLFKSWLVSYFIIIAVCVAFSILVYCQAESLIKDEINSSSQMLTDQIGQSIDQRLTDIQQLAVQISFDKAFQNLCYASGPLSNYDYYTEMQTAEDFSLLKSSNNYIDFFYVWISGIDTYPASNGTYGDDILYQSYFADCGLSYTQWKEMQSQSYTGSFIHTGNKPESPTIVYMKSVIFNDKKHKTTISILFNKDKMLNALQNVNLGSKRTVGIIDEDGSILSSTAGSNLSGIRYSLLTKPKGISYQTLGRVPMAVCYMKSSVSDWVFVNAIPVSVYQGKLDRIRFVTFICLLVSFIVSGLIAYFIVRRNYHPVKDIIEYVTGVEERENAEGPNGQNEFSFIHDFIKSTQQEKEKYLKGWEQHRAAIRDNFIVRLLKGEISPVLPLEDTLASYKIVFASDQYAVILFRVEECDSFSDGNSPDDTQMVNYAVCNVADEVASRHNVCYTVNFSNVTACLVNLRMDDSEQNGAELSHIADECRNFFQNQLGMVTTIAVSSIHKGYSGIHTAYSEAIEAMEYSIVLGSGSVIEYRGVKPSANRCFDILSLEQKLLNAIKAGDLEGSREILSDAFTQVSLSSMPSVDMAKCFMFGLVNSMTQALWELDSIWNKAVPSPLASAGILLGCRDLNCLRKRMNQLLEATCCSVLKMKKKNSNDMLLNKITEYVQENYKNQSLSVTGIADALRISPVYISKFFKEHTGETLLDCINHTRLDYAKQLMRQKDLSIASVATAVGYYNSNAFIRLFKKYEGITPGKFRDMNY